METIKINPEECEIFGNIISNKHGYLEDKNDFESHKCMVSLNKVKPDEWESYNVYSFKLSKDVSLTNRFSEDIQYCKESSLSSLFVCEHFDFNFNPYSDFFEVVPFRNGYTLKVKETYLSGNVDLTSPFFLLIHQNNKGYTYLMMLPVLCFHLIMMQKTLLKAYLWDLYFSIKMVN